MAPIQETCPESQHRNVAGDGDSPYMRGESVDRDNPDRNQRGTEAKREAKEQYNAQATEHQLEVCHGESLMLPQRSFW